MQSSVIIIAGLWIYWPALHGTWLWDDDVLVSANANLHSLQGLGRIWFSAPTTDYWPLSWTVLWLEWQLWGNQPLGFHLCSLGLHICSGLLVWRLFDRLGLRWGWIGGLLFVLYPLMVESVAWIAEIKNTLSLPFFLLSFDAWLDAEERKPSGYVRSALYYLAAMLAKTSTVMLPGVILLYCWWKRGRVTRQEIKRIIPYLAIALVLGLVTIYFQRHRQDSNPIQAEGLVTRLIGSGTNLFFYLEKFFLPVNLLPIYPRWTLQPPTPIQLLPLPVLAGLLFGLWTRRKSWGRHVLFAFGFFLLNLLPVLGLVEMQYMSITRVADHLAYLPIIGLVGLAVLGWEQLYQRVPLAARPYSLGVLTMVMALLAWESRTYANLFVDQNTLWTYTLTRNPQAWPAQNGLGYDLMLTGHMQGAIEHFNEALRIEPDYAEAHCNLGIALMQTGHVAEALEQFRQATQLKPDFPGMHYNWGIALLQAGRASEAIEQFKETANLNPDFADAHINWGIALDQLRRVPEAIDQYEEALRLKSNFAEAHNNLGRDLLQEGRISEATEQFEDALRLKPGYADARHNLAIARARQQTAPMER